jgi:aminoglycoside phosphotransferase (APT) family kinase protein
MPQSWFAEVDVSVELAEKLIRSQFPALCRAEVVTFGEGWDNSVYLVNGAIIFRFPRREFAGPLILSECRILPLISSRVPVPVPIPEYFGRPENGYPWHFAGYRKLPGQAASEIGLDDGERACLAEPLAHFLKALHATPIEDAIQCGVTGDVIGRLDLGKRTPLARKLLDRFGPSLSSNVGRLHDLLEDAPMDYRPRTDTLVHGDLYGRHLLLDSDQRLCGVIDWGDCHVGDRAIDLLPIFTVLPKAARERFFEKYGTVDSLTVRIARARALYHTLNVLNYARDIGDTPLEREALVGLGHLAE